MPSPKTEATELSVAFGLLDTNPFETSEDAVSNLFERTLPPDKFRQFKNSILAKRSYYDRLIYVGRAIRQAYPPFRNLRSLIDY